MNRLRNDDNTEAARGDDHSGNPDESEKSDSPAEQAKQREQEMEKSGEESPG